ncbi:MAG: trehalose-phosphatase [Nitrospirota bacterium]
MHKVCYVFERDNSRNIFSRIESSRKIALFLDYDGTLVPIQEDPGQCFLSDKMKKQLRLLAKNENRYLTILSGRSLADIKKMAGIRKIYYGGNHGLDISGPDIRYTHPKALLAKPIINHVKDKLKKEIENIKGAWLEDKRFTLSLHFRTVKKENIQAVKKVFYKTVAEFLNEELLVIIKGKKVLELIPNALWDKGRAVCLILQKLKKDCLPVYIGDDQTDETAFKALHKKGITIRVGKSKKTFADYYLKGHWEVSRLLQQFSDF